MRIKTIEFKKGQLKIIDQRQLPVKLVYITLKSLDEVVEAIKTLAVRGAPAIGVCAAYGVFVGISQAKTPNKRKFFKEIDKIAQAIKKARPTAVNLFWAVDRVIKAARKNEKENITGIRKIILAEAKKIQYEDEKMCLAIGVFGEKLVSDKDTILTHCNAGALATAGQGTALSPIYEAKKRGKHIKVFVDETRPLLQGARLTAWELGKNKIDATLILSLIHI